jgi:signal transduction histidine kinase
MNHSASHCVSVHLSGNQDDLILTVADDGVGFDVNAVAGKGIGLVSIRERLQMLGGSVNIRSRPGRGTRLEMSVPLCPVPVVERQLRSGAGRVA